MQGLAALAIAASTGDVELRALTAGRLAHTYIAVGDATTRLCVTESWPFKASPRRVIVWVALMSSLCKIDSISHGRSRTGGDFQKALECNERARAIAQVTGRPWTTWKLTPPSVLSDSFRARPPRPCRPFSAPVSTAN